MDEKVVLVTTDDQELGVMEKMQAHEDGLLHRAFSVFIFNNKGEMLLQKRASGKYHSPGKWTNAVCSHPRQGETYEEAAQRRMQEELGFSCPLEYRFNFIYKADVGQDLWEHELDYVFSGTFDGEYLLNKDEVEEIRFITLEDLERELQDRPENFTEWFKIILNQYRRHLKIDNKK